MDRHVESFARRRRTEEQSPSFTSVPSCQSIGGKDDSQEVTKETEPVEDTDRIGCRMLGGRGSEILAVAQLTTPLRIACPSHPSMNNGVEIAQRLPQGPRARKSDPFENFYATAIAPLRIILVKGGEDYRLRTLGRLGAA